LPQNEDLETEINKALKEPLQITQPIKFLTPKEIQNIIQEGINPGQVPGYDLITGRTLKEMSRKGIVHLTTICNAIIRTGYFAVQWKVVQVIMIPKPGEPLEKANSYRPISLLPIMSKVFEKAMLKRLRPTLEENRILPDHQFGFRRKHCHRISTPNYRDNKRNFKKKQYYSAAFLDITQAFDKVWHPGVLFEIRNILPYAYYRILQTHLTDRLFQVKFKDEITTLRKTEAGVRQGRVLGPVLYLIYPSDLPTSDNTNNCYLRR
jgi:hypothetical protein